MVGEPVEQDDGHLGVAEYGRPLAEGQVVVTMIEVRSYRSIMRRLMSTAKTTMHPAERCFKKTTFC
ncbi:hypothetical protein RP75_26745 [Agrobacterium arsenijevicii]|uniref:Uncharacterized protein n=1 Tax=Agrobacterium arsenijevicii TaxID=1585697 RepID=A0ABR5CZV1_9HYPH|nr:hypothetical protein RP75_26745 [Agrobacterium arsenijevicii]